MFTHESHYIAECSEVTNYANVAPCFLAHKHSVLSYGEGENGVHVNGEDLASTKVEAKWIGDKCQTLQYVLQ